MKKIIYAFILVLVASLAVCLTGCGSENLDDSKLIKLEDALRNQQNVIDDYETLLTDYEIRITDLEDNLSKLKSQHKTTQTKANDSEKKIAELEAELENLQKTSDLGIKVYLADQYYLVVDDTFQLFYRSVIRAVDPYGYYIKVSGNINSADGGAHALNRYFEFIPKKVGTYELTIDVRDSNGNVLGTDTTKLIVSAKTKAAASAEKTILCIGDSLTSSGDWVARGVSKYNAAGGKATTVGTVTKSYNSKTYYHEGRGGWQWSSFLTKYDSSTYSPFNPTGSNLSIRDYCTKNGFGEITEFYIMMTFNGLPGAFTEFSFESSFIKDAKQLIDLIHKEYPNAKITLMNLPLTSTNAGLGAYYNVSSTYSDNYGKAVTVLHYGDFLEQWCKSDEYKSFMRYLDIKAQFDSEYNMPYEQKQVNTTNSSVKENIGNAMGMHPTTNGYYQIGDAVYRALMSNW